jgi:hypothetical protein
MRYKHSSTNTEYEVLASTTEPKFMFPLHWLQDKLNLTEDEVTKNHPKFSLLIEIKVRIMKINGHYSDFSQSEKIGLDNYCKSSSQCKAFARPEFLLATFPKIWNF